MAEISVGVSDYRLMEMIDDKLKYQNQIDELTFRMERIDNKLEMVLNVLSGTNIEGIETKIKEIENG